MNGRKGDIGEGDLHAHADDALALARKAEVDEHLARRPEDAALVAEWRAHKELLHEAFDEVLDEPVPIRLSPFRLASRTVRRRPRLLAVVSLSFAAGLGSGGLMMLGLVSVDRPVVQAALSGSDPLATRALIAHRTFVSEVRHPVEVAAAEEAHLVQWLSKRLEYSIRIPDLRPEGFSLLGGRLLSSDEGPAALLMFENSKGERLTLYCARSKKDRETSLRYAEKAGSATFYWTDHRAQYALSGPAEPERLKRIAKRIYDAFDEEEGRSG